MREILSFGEVVCVSKTFFPIKLYICKEEDLSNPFWNSKLISLTAGLGKNRINFADGSPATEVLPWLKEPEVKTTIKIIM